MAPVCLVCAVEAGDYKRLCAGGYSLHKCSACGLEYADPIPSEKELRAFYASYQDVRADSRVVSANADDHLRFLERFGWSRESVTVDFGCGAGAFLEAAGSNCWGVELNTKSQLRTVSTLSELPYSTFDFVTLWGVLEHLRDPKATLLELQSRLKPQGIIALTTVNAEGPIPYYFKPPEHLSYWTRRALDLLAASCALEVLHCEEYWMTQLADIYLSRLLSRTPPEIRSKVTWQLPEFVQVPTNELRAVLRKAVA